MASIRRGWGMQEQHMDDFHLEDEEAACIAEALDIPFTTEEMNRYIRAHHTENPDFAKKNPSSFPVTA